MSVPFRWWDEVGVAEVAGLHERHVVAEVGGRRGEHEVAVAEDVGPLGDGEAEVHVLLDQEHGGACLVGHRAQQRHQALDDHRRESEAELVDEQQLR